MAKLTIFQHLENLTSKKVAWNPDDDEQTKSYQPFMINKWISMSEVCIPLIQRLDRFNLSKEVHYNYLLSVLPKRKLYFKYMKKKKETTRDPKVVECICKYFEIGPRHVEGYLEVLDEEQIQEIVEVYRYGFN